MIGNPGRKIAEFRDSQNHHALPDESLVSQPSAPVREDVTARRGAVKIRFSHDQRKIARTHLAMSKSLAHRPVRSQLVGGQSEHDDTGPGAFLQQLPHSKIPVQIMCLLNSKPPDLILLRQLSM